MAINPIKLDPLKAAARQKRKEKDARKTASERVAEKNSTRLKKRIAIVQRASMGRF